MNFPTTRWSLIVASGESEAARTAWSELAANYRSAIHAYFRCRFGTDMAEDLTQAFFAESIAGGWWARADLDRGSFRTYLRMLLRRFGVRRTVGSTRLSGSGQDVDDLVDSHADPEVAYERDFARTLVGRALARLRDEQPDPREHEALLPSLLHRGDHGDLKRLAVDLGLTHNTLLQRLRRMRIRLRELLRDEFTQLVADPASINVELLRIQRNLKHKKI
jgi:DNA-directed RNA polymerase specialized sigma24 family protein